MQGDLDSFLIEITSLILPKKDDKGDGFLVDKILDKTGMKGTGAAQQQVTLLYSSSMQTYTHSVSAQGTASS